MARIIDLTRMAGRATAGGHPEKEVVHQRRKNSGQQTHVDAVLVRANQREKVDGKEKSTSLRHQVCQLGKQDVSHPRR